MGHCEKVLDFMDPQASLKGDKTSERKRCQWLRHKPKWNGREVTKEMNQPPGLPWNFVNHGLGACGTPTPSSGRSPPHRRISGRAREIQKTQEKRPFSQISLDLLKPPSLEPPFAALQLKSRRRRLGLQLVRRLFVSLSV